MPSDRRSTDHGDAVPVAWRGSPIAVSAPAALGAPSRPADGTPRRAPNSVRRTTVFDCRWLQADELASIAGSGRDAATDAAGALSVLTTSSLAAEVSVGPPNVIEAVAVEPDVIDID